ncbi:MAG TPA: hypothetical protein VME46_08125 [Acidimicrobiales bacterium]|nr:hypothetical protein [Acidimicrobiales bacterium]
MARTTGSRRRLSKVGGASAAVAVAATCSVAPCSAGALAPVAATRAGAAANAPKAPEPVEVTLPGAPGCPIFPTDNVWNTPVDNLPVDPRSGEYIAAIGPNDPLHPDFGRGDWDGEPMGIPFNIVSGRQARVPVNFMYSSESDPGPYPVPPNALIEGGPTSSGDRHVLVLDTGNCTDYEMWAAYPKHGGASWQAGSGAVFPLESNRLRPATWTSADAAGLPILPGLVVASEVEGGAIDHAIRVTVPCTDTRFIWPARHQAGQDDPNCPPMGLRLRLKANVAISGYPRMDRVILQALKTYGMIVADNGSPWYISGAGSNYWDNDVLHEITQITGRDFEVVDESCLEVSSGSAEADPAHCPRL